jgi:plastocyanin
MRAALVVLAVVGLSACGGGGGGGSQVTSPPPSGNTPPPSNGITVSNNSYSPGAKTVAAGATVQWAWNTCTGDAYSGQTCVSHSVTFDDGATSPTQDQGTYQRTFATAGVYTYHCAVHGAAMAGSITVQ